MSQINVNTITGKDGGSAVNFPNGITVTGVVTATTLNQNVTGNVTAGRFTGDLTGDVTGTATVATNAQGLTGTPNITVGTITGTDATLSGNLTVNGTTTTIDTAITEVDSLAVDGSVGIGTTNPESSTKLDVRGTVIASSFGSSALIPPSGALTPSWKAVSSGSDPTSVPSGLTSVSTNAVLSQGSSEQIFLDLGSSVTTVTFDFKNVPTPIVTLLPVFNKLMIS